MKKLHGTYSIQPLTITDAVIAEDAKIAESKLDLHINTGEIQQTLDGLSSDFAAHLLADADPHGEILHQTTVQTEDIQSGASDGTRVVSISNPGDGDVILSVEGDINAVNATFSGDTSIAGITTIGGQTHITGDVVIDGNLSVSGETTTVESNTIDYDSLLVTPSTALNRTGIIVAPDGTGFTDEDQSQTTTETITVHDDIVDTGRGYMGAPIRALSNGDLIITLGNRVVKTNPEATEIKATYHVEGGYVEEISGAAINSNDEISIIVGNSSNYGVPESPYDARRDDFRIVTLDSDLEFIRESGILFEGQNPALIYPISFEYNNGKYYALYTFTNGSYGLCIYDEIYIDANSGEESPNNFIHCTEYHDVSGLHAEESLSSIGVYDIAPFTHNDQDYIFIIGHDNMFVVDDNMHLQGYEMWDSTDENYDRYACMDVTVSGVVDPINKMFYTVGYDFFVYGFPITCFLDADTYVSELEVIRENTISTIPVMFDDSFSSMEELMDEESEFYGGHIRGILSDGTVLYFSEDSHNIYWLNPAEFGNTTLEAFAEQEEFELEFSPGLEADFVTHVRRFIVTDEDEENAGVSIEPEEENEESEEDVYGRDLIRIVTREIEVTPESEDTFTGNLLELQKRVNGLNSAAVIVDKDGNLKLLTGGLDVNGVKGETVNNVLTFNKALASTAITTSDGGFVYKPASNSQPNSKVLDIQAANGVSNAFINKNGDAMVNSLTIGISNPITESSGELSILNDMVIVNSEVKLDGSVLTVSAENKDDWSILNRNSSVSFYHDDEQSPQVELSDDLFDLSNCELTKTDDLLVLGSATFSGNVNMGANMTMDGIKVGSHDHTGGDMGTVLPQTAVTGLKTFIDNINTTIQSCVDTMTKSNTESGINVAFNSTSKKLNFTVNDFTLTLTGDASGSATIAHVSNTSLVVTVKNSAKLGGLSLPSTTANTEANKVLRTDASGNTTVKNLIINPPAAGTNTIDKVFATYANDNTIRYYTPANFATQILALGGTTKNSHTHTAVNGLTPVRGSSTFNGVSGRVIMLSTTRANTNYSVAVTPTAQPNGNLGEVWVIKATDRFTVYNSGVATSAFDYIMLG